MRVLNDVEVKGCGCRYRNDKAEYLCDDDKNEFILMLFNWQYKLRKEYEATHGVVLD